MAEKESIVVREARSTDKDAVMKIRDNVYGGRDYLLSYYDSFINSDNCYPFVVVIDDEIVAFGVACIVDDMKTVVTRAGRISEKHAGKKLTHLMFNTFLEKVRSLGVEQEHFTTTAGNPVIHKDTFKNRNQFISRKEGVSYLVERSKWLSNQSSENPRCINRIPEAADRDLNLYISSQSYRNYLFPDGIIVVDLVPYQPLQSNFKLIRNHDNRLILSNVREENGSMKGLVSIASFFQCSARFYGCNFDIYGTDTSSFKQHLLQCVEFLTLKTEDPISLVIFVDPLTNRAEMKKAADTLGLQEYLWEENVMRLNKLKLYVFQSKL